MKSLNLEFFISQVTTLFKILYKVFWFMRFNLNKKQVQDSATFNLWLVDIHPKQSIWRNVSFLFEEGVLFFWMEIPREHLKQKFPVTVFIAFLDELWLRKQLSTFVTWVCSLFRLVQPNLKKNVPCQMTHYNCWFAVQLT